MMVLMELCTDGTMYGWFTLTTNEGMEETLQEVLLYCILCVHWYYWTLMGRGILHEAQVLAGVV